MINKYLDLLEDNFGYPTELAKFKSNAMAAFADGIFDEEEKVVSLFGVDGKLTRNKFYRTKKWVKILYSYLEEEGLVTSKTINYINGLSLADISIEEEIAYFYFRDLDSVLDFIDEVAQSYVGREYEECYMDIRAMAIFAWYGFDASEMASAEKSSVIIPSNEIAVGSKRVSIDRKYLDIVFRYANSESYVGISGNRYSFKDSDRLFRSRKTASKTEDNLYVSIGDFNALAAEKFARKIHLRALNTNQTFCQMYKDGVSPGDLNAFSKYYPEEEKKVFFMKVMYERWLEIYYG